MINGSLIVYLMAGYPNKRESLDALLEIEKFADVIELGVPFSDPVADGKTIQRASYIALKNGFRIKDLFEAARTFREHSEKPLITMTYYNPVYAMGVREFVERAKKAGVTGMLVVDLPVDEAAKYIQICRESEVETIFLAAPNTDNDRLRIIDENSAFVYLISTYGVTGSRNKISDLVFPALKRVKAVCKKPVAVGFGVSKAEHVRQLIEAGADGVVSGSAVIRALNNGVGAATELVKELKSAIER